ncbi:hypothetical protein TNCV_4218501 [Trichonephila clavipes]|nr:hypothetical protein TNCV_4218501 [Trichonephila clavipes]
MLLNSSASNYRPWSVTNLAASLSKKLLASNPRFLTAGVLRPQKNLMHLCKVIGVVQILERRKEQLLQG